MYFSLNEKWTRIFLDPGSLYLQFSLWSSLAYFTLES